MPQLTCSNKCPVLCLGLGGSTAGRAGSNCLFQEPQGWWFVSQFLGLSGRTSGVKILAKPNMWTYLVWWPPTVWGNHVFHLCVCLVWSHVLGVLVCVTGAWCVQQILVFLVLGNDNAFHTVSFHAGVSGNLTEFIGDFLYFCNYKRIASAWFELIWLRHIPALGDTSNVMALFFLKMKVNDYHILLSLKTVSARKSYLKCLSLSKCLWVTGAEDTVMYRMPVCFFNKLSLGADRTFVSFPQTPLSGWRLVLSESSRYRIPRNLMTVLILTLCTVPS